MTSQLPESASLEQKIQAVPTLASTTSDNMAVDLDING
jgi:hypothetical protein